MNVINLLMSSSFLIVKKNKEKKQHVPLTTACNPPFGVPGVVIRRAMNMPSFPLTRNGNRNDSKCAFTIKERNN